MEFFFQLTPRAVIGFFCVAYLILVCWVIPKWLGDF